MSRLGLEGMKLLFVRPVISIQATINAALEDEELMRDGRLLN